MLVRTSLVALVLVVAVSLGTSGGQPPRPADNPPAKDAPTPTPSTMHDFMESVFQGPHRRLKTAIAAEPKDNAGWKVVRSEALILAEGGNLLLLRKPEKDAAKWTEYSIASRDAGSEVYKLAKKKDYAGARKAYEKMLTSCNACHKQFDEGKNQLAP